MAGIDYSPLGKAVQRLNEGLEALGREPGNTLYRDAVILRFRIAFDMSVGFLQRHLAIDTSASPEYAASFKRLIRNAGKVGVLRSDSDAWLKFREARALTSLAYSEEIAQKVMDEIPQFFREAEFLYSGLRQ